LRRDITGCVQTVSLCINDEFFAYLVEVNCHDASVNQEGGILWLQRHSIVLKVSIEGEVQLGDDLLFLL